MKRGFSRILGILPKLSGGSALNRTDPGRFFRPPPVEAYQAGIAGRAWEPGGQLGAMPMMVPSRRRVGATAAGLPTDSLPLERMGILLASGR